MYFKLVAFQPPSGLPIICGRDPAQPPMPPPSAQADPEKRYGTRQEGKGRASRPPAGRDTPPPPLPPLPARIAATDYAQRPAGVQNPEGSTCYISVVLQSLAHTPGILKHLQAMGGLLHGSLMTKATLVVFKGILCETGSVSAAEHTRSRAKVNTR